MATISQWIDDTIGNAVLGRSAAFRWGRIHGRMPVEAATSGSCLYVLLTSLCSGHLNSILGYAGRSLPGNWSILDSGEDRPKVGLGTGTRFCDSERLRKKRAASLSMCRWNRQSSGQLFTRLNLTWVDTWLNDTRLGLKCTHRMIILWPQKP